MILEAAFADPATLPPPVQIAEPDHEPDPSHGVVTLDALEATGLHTATTTTPGTYLSVFHPTAQLAAFVMFGA